MTTTFFRPPIAALVSAAALAGVLVPSEAKAFVVTLPDNSKWEISTISGPLGFEEGVLLGQQTWFTDSSDATRARLFAQAVQQQGGNTFLGFSQTDTTGPLFAYNTTGATVFSSFARTSNGVLVNTSNNASRTVTYAIATEVPGPLPVLGAFAAFGWSRRMRQRIRISNPTHSVTQS